VLAPDRGYYCDVFVAYVEGRTRTYPYDVAGALQIRLLCAPG
jgi:hypothetical protein